MARIVVALALVLGLAGPVAAQSYEQNRAMRQLDRSEQNMRQQSFERDVRQRSLDQSITNRTQRNAIENQIRTQQFRPSPIPQPRP